MQGVATLPLALESVAGLPIAGEPTEAALFASFNGGSHNWSPQVPGLWKFVGVGPGAAGDGGGNGGASGGYFEVTRRLSTVDVVPIAVGVPATSDTTVTLPGGVVATATRAILATAGTATGGDVNLSGTAGGAPGAPGLGTGGGAAGPGAAGGSGAPANLPFRGGVGGDFNAGSGSARSGGIGAGAADQANAIGGPGLVLAFYVGA